MNVPEWVYWLTIPVGAALSFGAGVLIQELLFRWEARRRRLHRK